MLAISTQIAGSSIRDGSSASDEGGVAEKRRLAFWCNFSVNKVNHVAKGLDIAPLSTCEWCVVAMRSHSARLFDRAAGAHLREALRRAHTCTLLTRERADSVVLRLAKMSRTTLTCGRREGHHGRDDPPCFGWGGYGPRRLCIKLQSRKIFAGRRSRLRWSPIRQANEPLLADVSPSHSTFRRTANRASAS